MKKKPSFLLFLMTISIFLLLINPVQAAEKHVSDCLGAEEDCLEELEQPETNKESVDKETMATPDIKTGSLFINIVKMIVALLLVLALIYILLLFIKRKNRLFQQVGVIENVGGISVGQNKSIQIIRIGETMYVVGVGENVEMLKEITDEQLIQSLQEKRETTLQAPSFLQSFLPKKGSEKHSEGSSENQFTSKLQNELFKLKQNRNKMMDQYEKKDDEHV